MVSIKYAYLILGLLFLLIWIALYLFRKDVRREMIIMSIAFGIGGVLAEKIYLRDWWHPITITNTSIGIEDFLFGFTIGGIASVIYEVLFRRRIKEKRFLKLLTKKHLLDAFIILLLPIIFFTGNMYFGLNTLHASLFGYGVPLLIIYYRRRDLIVDSIVSGISLLAIVFLIYTVMEFLVSGWVVNFWTFQNVSPIIFLNVPIDDLVWYVFTGAFIGVMYVFLEGSHLFRLKKRIVKV